MSRFVNSKVPFAREYQMLSTTRASSGASGRNSYCGKMLQKFSKVWVSDRMEPVIKEVKNKETVPQIGTHSRNSRGFIAGYGLLNKQNFIPYLPHF